MPDLPLTGGCACGAIRYELSAPPLMVYNCHCKVCQKTSASAFNISVAVPEAGLRITGEPGRYEWQAASGTLRFGLFCRTCGTRICNGQSPNNRVLSLRGGTLDDTSWLKPVGDIWTSSAQPWVTFVEGGLRAEKQQADYAPWIAAFAAQGLF